jgi:hypothetical protein
VLFRSLNSVSYTGVALAGTLTTTFGSSTTASQALTCTPGKMIVNGLGCGATSGGTTLASPTGGNNRFLANASGVTGLVISDSTASATFSATLGISDPWSAAGIVLTPPALPRGMGRVPIYRASLY